MFGWFVGVGAGGENVSMAYKQGTDFCISQTDNTLNQAKALVNKCADMAMIVIDERDACQKRLLDLNGCVKGNTIYTFGVGN